MNVYLFVRLAEAGRCPRRHTVPVAVRARQHATCPSEREIASSTPGTRATSACAAATRRDCAHPEPGSDHCSTVQIKVDQVHLKTRRHKCWIKAVYNDEFTGGIIILASGE